MKRPIIINQKKQRDGWREWLHTVFWAGLIAIVFRSFLLEPFNIPSGSMIPTLHVGDHLFVSKWNYGYSRFSFPFGSWNLWDGRMFEFGAPRRGDVIVFRNTIADADYVKRLIGMPGDTIQMKSGRLYINNIMVERVEPARYVIANISKRYKDDGVQHKDLFIKGNKISQADGAEANFNYTIEYKDDDICRRIPAECMIEDAVEWIEILPGGVKHRIVEISDYERFDNTEPFKVPDNHYFMMGDDRDHSADSRSAGLGYVPYDNLMGKAWVIFYSHNYFSPVPFVWDWPEKMRWGRYGMIVK